MERKATKIYYTMGEVSEMFDVNPSLIRFWEQQFDALKPHKNKKGNRLFTPADVETLKIIYHLVKEKGMTLAGAQKRLKENRKGEEHTLEVVEKLQGIRSLLLEIKQELRDEEGESVVLIDNPFPIEPVAEPNAIAEHTDLTPESTASSEEPTVAAVPAAEVTPEAESQSEEKVIPRVIEQTLF